MIAAMPKDRGKPVLVVAGSDFAQSCGYRPCVGENDAGEVTQRGDAIVYGIVNRTKAPPMQVGAFPVAPEECDDEDGSAMDVFQA
jgi:hypothetical protein